MGPKIYRIGCLIGPDGSTIPCDATDARLREYEADARLIAKFAEGEAGPKDAQEVLGLECGLSPISEMFFEDTRSADEVHSFFEGNDSTPPLFNALNRDEVKTELRHLIARVLPAQLDRVEALGRQVRRLMRKLSPAESDRLKKGEFSSGQRRRYERKLEPYGLAGKLIQWLKEDERLLSLVREGWRQRVSLDDLPERLWSEGEMVLECALFEWAGFRLVCCETNRHWFLADYHRRRDCRAHERVGRMRRLRTSQQ